MIYTYPQLIKALYHHGTKRTVRDHHTKELINVTLKIDKYNLFYSSLARPLCDVFRYMLAEFIWYMSGKRSVKYISRYSKFWNKLIDMHGNANSNYGYLVFYKKNKLGISGFEWARRCLMKDEFHRGAVILYNDRDYYYNNNVDYICTQLQQFFIRDEKLYSTVYIRSSDVILGLSYDIPWWSFVQQQLYHELKKKYTRLTVADITVHIGSAHYYDDKEQLLYQLTRDGFKKKVIILNRFVPLECKLNWYIENLYNYINIYPDNDVEQVNNQVMKMIQRTS